MKLENCQITCYSSGKVVFQGKDAEVYASPFLQPAADEPEPKSAVILPQAGSDEVGTGDYFGPVCVCATIVQPQQLALLQQLGVRDSKALNDTDIRRIAPELMKTLTYSLLIVDNAKYNQVHAVSNMTVSPQSRSISDHDSISARRPISLVTLDSSHPAGVTSKKE